MTLYKSKIYESGIRSLQLDLTTRCNAACPQCSRTGRDELDDNPDEITLEKFKKYFPVEFIKQLEVVKFCGNFGDPAFAKDCVEIHEYLDSVNPNVAMSMHTNGGIRDRKFWQRLARVYAKHPQRLLFFHIDGLKDTNHIYRVNVDYDTVIKNASIAIAEKASCVWAFIPFMHNEHQLEEAEELSKQLGFKVFMVKISSRFGAEQKPVVFYDKKLQMHKTLYPPTSPEFDISEMVEPKEYPTCSASIRRDIFVDARGNAVPCCWYASSVETVPRFKQEIDKYGVNLNERSLEEVLSSELYNGAIEKSWERKNSTLSTHCYKKCTGKFMHFWKLENKFASTEQAKWADFKSSQWMEETWGDEWQTLVSRGC